MSRRKKLPTELFTASISTLNPDGSGLTEHDGRTLRVFGALPREEISARYRFGRQFRGQAEVLTVENAAPERVEPRCPHYGVCSACALQHMDYDAQLAFKQEQMLRHLKETGGVQPARLLPPLTAGPWHYRRKARLSVRFVPRKERVLVGFREQDKRFVTDMRECHTLVERLAGQVEGLCDLLNTMDARQSIPQIEASCGDEDCALVFRHLEPLSAEDVRRLAAYEAGTGTRIWLQSKGPETAQPLSTTPSGLSYELPEQGIRISFDPLDFMQINGGLNRLMITQALDLLQVGPDHRVLDLFCGLGNFTLPLARQAGQVTGLEGSAALVARAGMNARRNDLNNVQFTLADLYSEPPGSVCSGGAFDRVLLDPPRSGAAAILPLLAATGAGRVLYVSCNPETLAQDAGQLVGRHGFRLEAAGILDMFPQTPQIETMALFQKNGQAA